jgi:hypothetical protein
VIAMSRSAPQWWYPLYESIADTVHERRIALEPDLSPDSGVEVSFANEWLEFVRAVEDIAGKGTVHCTDHEKAWDHFGPVFAKTYAYESDFSNALFDALRDSLAGVCTENLTENNKEYNAAGGESAMTSGHSTWRREMRLRSTNVGFATDFYRSPHIAFPRNYAAPSRYKADHACVLFRHQEEDVHPKGKSRPPTTTQVSSSGSQLKAEWRRDEVTAVVELRLDSSSCSGCYMIDYIDLRRKHGPIGVALMYMMEVWHTLAKRGQVASSLPVVVLSGRSMKLDTQQKTGYTAEGLTRGSQPHSGAPASANIKLCCVQARLDIPECLGEQFQLQVGRQIMFPEGRSDGNYKDAMGVYLNAMTDGLQRAHAIREAVNPQSLSLCCYAPIPNLRLVASPIPFARTSSDFSVHQGELFEFTEDLPIEDWLDKLEIGDVTVESLCLVDRSTTTENCLVKVSFLSVHNTLVPLKDCWKAMDRLAGSDVKSMVSDVVLACSFISGHCLVLMMKNLSPKSDPFQDLSHDNFPDRPAVWRAFCKLVQNVMLPMASLDIVHNDIRCVPKGRSGYRVYNILGKRDPDGAIELKLIDYDSLVVFDPCLKQIPMQQHAVSTGWFFSYRSAYEFLFWQVLWMAYVLWFPEEEGFTRDAKTESFVPDFYHGDGINLEKFREWLNRDRMASLEATSAYFKMVKNKLAKTRYRECDNVRTNAKINGQIKVNEILVLLGEAFDSCHFDA